MYSKKTSVLQLFLGVFTLIALLVPVMGKAEQASAELRYSHVDKASLSDAQKGQILQGQPPLTADADATVLLVYEADGSCAVTPQKPMLPHTGDRLSLLAILGVGLLVFSVFVWQKKKYSLFLAFLLLSGGMSFPALAESGLLGADTIRQSGEGFSPESIPCYRYVGYLVPSVPTTTETTTTVTESTSSTTTATTTETTTTTTTSSTTTTTEATTTVPSNPTPPVVTPPLYSGDVDVAV